MLGVDGCPEGSSPIDDEATCQKVQQAVGKAWQPRKPEKGAVCNWCGGCSKAGTIRLSAAHGAKAKWLCKADAVAMPKEKAGRGVAAERGADGGGAGDDARAAGGGSATKTPMQRVVELIAGLRQKVVTDGQVEQTDYNTYACWCEDTLGRKANDISASKDLIAESEILIKKLEGQIASHGAEIEGLAKDIAKNQVSQKEAADVRAKAFEDYSSERSENEQCIGALEAAIKTLTGAGTKKSFLDTSTRKAQVLSVAAQLRTVLRHKAFSQSAEEKDLDMVKNFVAKPEAFMAAHLAGMSAAQVGQNPFGDYAPQSTQIQGILKGMYDAFTSDLEKDNAEEAETQKSFEELMATKAQELATLEATLQKHETDEAAKTKKLSESEVLLDDTTAQLEADETFFEDTKQACQAKATEWSVRTRMRTEELNGMQLAIKILSSEGAKKTFESSTTTFLQLAVVRKHTDRSSVSSKAYKQLKIVATQFRNRNVAKIAVELKSGGHFDKVITMIDDMIVLLRKEEQDDIEHRDRCENAQNANGNELADLKNDIKKTEASLKRMGNTKKDLEDEIGALEKEIAATKKDMAELLKFRNKESADFKQALLDDTNALALLKKAIVALSEFYKRNKMPLPSLIQKAPEYAEDPDKAPETSWSGSGYGGRKSESGGIIAILEMLAEDTEKEMKEGRADDADAQEKYLKQNGALQATLDSQEETKASTESELADLEEKMNDYEKFKNEKAADASAEEDNKKAIGTDCKWVKTHFDSRREKRKTEIQGLVDAKGFLAGVAAGNDPLPLAF